MSIKDVRKYKRKIANRVVSNAVKAVLFAQKHRFFTLNDLAVELEMSRPGAKRYLAALLFHKEIKIKRPTRYAKNCAGRLPALYGRK